jgi:hypothetical protein
MFHWGSLEREMVCFERGEIDDPYFHRVILDRIYTARWEAEYTEKLVKKFGRDPRILDKTRLCEACGWAFRGLWCGHSIKKYKNVLTGELLLTAELCESERRWYQARDGACLPVGRHWKPNRPGDPETSFAVLDDDNPQMRKLWAHPERYVEIGRGVDEEDVKVCRYCGWCNPWRWHGLLSLWDADRITCSKFQITADSAVRGKTNKGNPLCKQVRHPWVAKDDMRCNGEHWMRRR